MPDMNEIDKAIREAEAAQAMPGMPDESGNSEPERVVVEFNGSSSDSAEASSPSLDGGGSRDIADIKALLRDLIDVCRRGFDL